MKRLTLTPQGRIGKYMFPALTVFCLVFFIPLQLNAQEFTQWEQGASSDHFLNFNWAGNTDYSCDCMGGTSDNFKIIEPGLPSTSYFNTSRPHQGGNWSGTAQLAVGPGFTKAYDAQIFLSGGSNNFIDPCFAPCNPAFNAFNFIGGNLTVSTEPLRPPGSVSAVWNPDGSFTITWQVNTDIPESAYELWLESASNSEMFSSKSVVSWTDPCPDDNEIYELRTRYTPNGTFSATVSVNVNDFPQVPPNGRIDGRITTLNGNNPVQGVTVTAELMNPGDLTNASCWPSSYSAITDANGDYTIPFIYYGINSESANYQLTPTLPLHGFDPGMITRTLTAGDFNKTQDFKDTTSFTVSGIVLDANGCGVDSVYITATPGPVIPVYTNGDGTYDLVVPEVGEYQISAFFNEMTLNTLSVDVQADILNQNFAYTETDTLKGFVGAGCNEFIGQATLDFRTETGCLLQGGVMTNPSGYYEVVLPSREITAQLISISSAPFNVNPDTVINRVGSEVPVDLDSTTVLDFIYRKPLSIEFYGIPGAPCPAIDYPVLNQAEPYPITIVVWEEQGVCLADTGMVYILDGIKLNSTESIVLDSFPISNGIVQYTLVPGEPTLAAPYVKSINITAFTAQNPPTTETVEVIVSGTRQRTQTFVTGGPTNLPFLILRDPPGDRSKSFFEQNNTTQYAQSFSSLAGGGVRVWAKVKASANVFGLKFFGEIGGGISAGGSTQNTEETILTFENQIGVQTSDAPEVIGEKGDLIMGAAVNFIYGLADERLFDINTCSMLVDTVLVFSPDTFETTFILTTSDIRNDVIPSLELLATNPDTTEEARRKFRNEIDVWEQTLQLNEDLKREALQNNVIDNYSISATAGPFQSSTTASSSKKKSIEFKQYINGDIAASAGINFFGSVEVSAGVEVTIRGEFGQSESETQTTSTTTGFVFDDDDSFVDLISFDYAVDEVYGTPVFGPIIGPSSCPHEPGGVLVDNPVITVPEPVQFIQSGNDAFFTFILGNESEVSDTARTYVLDFVEQSNEFGVQVFNGGNPFSGTIPYVIEQGQTSIATIQVTRQESNPQYSFEGLQFEFYPECQYSKRKTVYLSVYFPNTCSSIEMPNPGNDWLVNSSSSNLLPVTMSGYALGDIDQVRLIYSPLGSQSWQETNVVIPGGNLLPPPQVYNWDVSNLEDGQYNIRYELSCGTIKNYSTRVQGRIDREPPAIFGNQEPKDDLYHPGDLISAQFREDISCESLAGGKVYFMTLPDSTAYSATYSCDGNEVFIDPSTDISGLYNQQFEVGLIYIEDLYGNPRTDTVKWQFIVSEPDSDKDGNPDTKDRCPGGNDFIDTDQDGLPDDCDCLPEVSANGRLLTKASMDFDGLDDLVTIPYAQELIPTSTNALTIEAWIYPKGDPNASVILASGDLPTEDFLIYMNNSTLIVSNSGALPIFSSDTIPFFEWTHIAVVYNLNERKLYINGQLDGIASGTWFSTLGNNITFGNQLSGAPENLNYLGQLDDVRFWDSVRSESQIQQNMHMEMAGSEPGLLAYYNFNEGTPFGDNMALTTIKDRTVNGHDGSLTSFARSGVSSNWVNSSLDVFGTPYEPCFNCPDTINTAMGFDGTDDMITITNNAAMIPTTSNEMTFELWYYPTDTTENFVDVIASSTGNLYFTRSSLGFQLQTFANSSPALFIPPFEWSHISVVFETGGIKIYINGSLEADYALTHQTVNAGNPISIGGEIGVANNRLGGKIDDVRFWSDIRTQEEILNNLFLELNGDEDGLVAYYNFNQGVPGGNNAGLTTIIDVTSNGNTGTPENFAKSGIKSNWISSPLNFPDGDTDGLPDPCDDCFAYKEVLVENTILGGIYRAEDKITLGTGLTFPVSGSIEFRAPRVEVLQVVPDVPAGVSILVAPVPCESP